MAKFNLDLSGKAQFEHFREDIAEIAENTGSYCAVFTGAPGLGKSTMTLHLLKAAGYIDCNSGEGEEEEDEPLNASVKPKSMRATEESKAATRKTNGMPPKAPPEVKAPQKYYKYFKGKISPKGTFQLLRAHFDKVIVFDDCDSVFTNVDACNLLKAASDQTGVRRVTWGIDKSEESFIFRGRIILLSNDQEGIPEPLYDRAIGGHLKLTPKEIVEQMVELISSDTYYPHYNIESKQICVNFIREQNKHWNTKFSLRLLGMSLDWFHKCPNTWERRTVRKMLNR